MTKNFKGTKGAKLDGGHPPGPKVCGGFSPTGPAVCGGFTPAGPKLEGGTPQDRRSVGDFPRQERSSREEPPRTCGGSARGGEGGKPPLRPEGRDGGLTPPLTTLIVGM